MLCRAIAGLICDNCSFVNEYLPRYRLKRCTEMGIRIFLGFSTSTKSDWKLCTFLHYVPPCRHLGYAVSGLHFHVELFAFIIKLQNGVFAVMVGDYRFYLQRRRYAVREFPYAFCFVECVLLRLYIQPIELCCRSVEVYVSKYDSESQQQTFIVRNGIW